MRTKKSVDLRRYMGNAFKQAIRGSVLAKTRVLVCVALRKMKSNDSMGMMLDSVEGSEAEGVAAW